VHERLSESESNCQSIPVLLDLKRICCPSLNDILYKKNGYNEMKFDIIAASHHFTSEFDERIIVKIIRRNAG
jgi:hypothetical protein